MIYHNKRMSLAGFVPEIFALIVGIVTGALVATEPYIGVTILLALGSVAVVTLFMAYQMGDGVKSKTLDLMGMTPTIFALVIGLVVGAVLATGQVTWWIIVLLFSVLFGVLALLYAIYPVQDETRREPASAVRAPEPNGSDKDEQDTY